VVSAEQVILYCVGSGRRIVVVGIGRSELKMNMVVKMAAKH